MTTLHDPEVRGFASDNYAGVHPEVLAAVAAANAPEVPPERFTALTRLDHNRAIAQLARRTVTSQA